MLKGWLKTIFSRCYLLIIKTIFNKNIFKITLLLIRLKSYIGYKYDISLTYNHQYFL